MTAAEPQSRNGNRRGDDAIIVTLFCIGWLCLFVLTAWLSRLFFLPKDALIGEIPADATAYIHENAGADGSLLGPFLELPEGVSPDELAVYAMDSTGKTIWRALLGWQSAPDPIAAGWLQKKSAAELRNNLYVLPLDPTDPKVDAVKKERPIENKKTATALAAFRESFPVQGYVRSSLPLKLLPAGFQIDNAENETYVFGAASRNGVIAISAAREADISPIHTLLGFSSGRLQITPPALSKNADEPVMTLAETRPTFDLSSFLISTIEKTRAAYGTPEHDALTAALADLRQTLESPYELKIFASSSRDNTDAQNRFLAHFFTVNETKLKGLLQKYITNAFPKKGVMVLPDKGTASVFMPEIPLNEAIIDGNKALAIQSDAKNGVLFASSGDLLPKNESEHNQAIRCRVNENDAYLYFNKDYVGLPWKIEVYSVDKKLFICGYNSKPVDNIQKEVLQNN